MSPIATEPAPVANLSFEPSGSRHLVFRSLWYTCNALLICSLLFLAYTAAWEYSTRRYLKGFSDAIVPESGTAQEKIEAILNWMSHGPARQEAILPTGVPDRDPTDTLNYASLLEVCGSATNAFVNLADSAGVPARRLLLLDARHVAKHVVAEAWLDGRWIVVDPSFRTILRGADGNFLTRQELTNPHVFANATGGIPGYDPAFTYEHTAHVRVARLYLIGSSLEKFLVKLVPEWQDSATISLLFERESLELLVLALALVILFLVGRIGLRWYGERRLGVQAIRFRQQVRRAVSAFVDTAS